MTPTQRWPLYSALVIVLVAIALPALAEPACTGPVAACEGKALLFESEGNVKRFVAAPEQFVSRAR